MSSDQRAGQPTEPRRPFLRLYSWAFCAVLWVVTVGIVVGLVTTDGEDRKPFASLAVIVGAMAAAATLLLAAVDPRVREETGA